MTSIDEGIRGHDNNYSTIKSNKFEATKTSIGLAIYFWPLIVSHK